MADRNYIVPEFGAFSGMRVLCSGSLIAMPYAATLLADFGAEVIHIERPHVGDTMRALPPLTKHNGKYVSTNWVQNSRNKLSMELDMRLNEHPEAREVFYDLIRRSDIFMENMVWLDKLGISDEELMKLNPALIIVHVSGMGHKEFGGIPEYCERASYDLIGQAFSGWLNIQGYKDRAPAVAKPYLNDFVSASAVIFGLFAAYAHREKTGKGQVVDVAQFEAMAMYMSGTYCSYIMNNYVAARTMNKNPYNRPYDLYKSRDDMYVAICAYGPAVYARCIEAIGRTLEEFPFEKCTGGADKLASEESIALENAIIAWCEERDAAEIEAILSAAKVPCSVVNTTKTAVENPHFRARNDFISYKDETTGGTFEAFGIAPKLSETPGMVWRGAPALGQDTDAILRTILEYDEEKISKLRESGIFG